MSTKVLSGNLRGSILNVPDSARPTLLRFRQSVFDLLTGLAEDPKLFFKDKIVLDCFAGSGALGIEALSRGAKYSYFVDISQKAISVIYENTEKLKLSNKCKIIKSDILSIRKFKGSEKSNLVFIDPPYGKVSILRTIKHLYNKDWIDKDSLIVTEEDYEHAEDLSSITTTLVERTYGRSIFKIAKIEINSSIINILNP